MSTRIRLEPEAQAFADAAAKPPYLFKLGPQKGRIALEEVQSGQVSKLPIHIEDLTIDDGPSGQVSLHILRPRQVQALLPVITAGSDVLRDGGEAYANKLREAKVRVTAVRFQGTIHDFVMLNALATSVAARGTIAFAIAWLREGFSTRLV